MKNTLLTLLFIFIAATVHPQRVIVGYSVGYGTYNMTDMKNYIKSVDAEMPSYVKLLDNFPGGLTHTVYAGTRIDRVEIGASGGYLTSGAKLSYADYSGEIMYKLVTSGVKIGAYVRYFFSSPDALFSVYGEVAPAVVASKFRSESMIRIYEEQMPLTQDVTAQSTDFSLQPMLGLNIRVVKPVTVNLSGGYDLTIASKIRDLGNFKLNWSGFRVNGGISVLF